ncbi:MAG: PAS domain S-box protein [Proteobacteria bacterium]|nr:PAS domain S-box protein [Pseudomonadota bacterium]MBU1596069.1 PAS domain S-box protein [Pseudomonadota bacterium]
MSRLPEYAGTRPSPFRPLPALVLLALLLALPALGARAQAADGPARPAAITVVSDDNYPPYIFRNDEGLLQGILVDQWQAWERATGVRVNLLAMDWARAQQFMQGGQADVIDTIFYNEERAKAYDFTKPYAKLDVPVFFHKTLGGITDLTSLRGFTVGVKAGDAVIDVLRRNGIHSLKEYDSYKGIIDAARTGEIRVFSIDAPPALYYLYKLNMEGEFRQAFVLYAGEFHRAVRKGDAALLRLVEDGFAAIAEGERRDIEEKWLGAPIASGLDLRRVLYAIAGVGALALALLAFNIVLRRRVRARTAELAETLFRLRESEERFRTMVETANEGVWRLDANFLTTYVNGTMARMLGYAPEEILGRRVTEFMFPEDHPAHEALLLERRAGASGRYERRFRTRDGEEVWTLASASPLRGANGEFLGSFGMFTDITERKLAGQALASSESTLRSLFSCMTDVILILDAEGRYLEIAPTNSDSLYRPPAELVGRTVAEVFAPEQAAYFLQVIGEALRTGASVSVDYRMPIGERECWFAGVVSRRTADSVIWVARDITERKRAEQSLFESRERLQLALDAANDGLWDWRLDTGEAYFSPRYYTMLGYEPGEFPANFESFSKLLHPDDREAITKSIAGSLRDDETNAFEIRMRTRSGEWKWILTRSRVVDRDASGAPTRLAGTHTDITERKQAEEALQASERRFSELIRNSSDSITILDKDGVQVFVSAAVERMLGYKPSELTGIPVMREMLHPDDQEQVAAAFAAILRDGKGGAQYRHRHKDGSWVHLEAWGTNQLENPDIRGVVVNVRDITERKNAEEAVARERVFTNALLDSVPGLIYLYDDQGRLMRWSKMHRDLLGYSDEELAQKHVLDWFQGDEQSLGVISQAIERVMQDGFAHAEADMQAKDGRRIPFYYTGLRMEIEGRRYLAGVGIDMTERKAAEAALLAKTALLEAQTNASLDGILVINERNERILYNSRLVELFQASGDVLASPDDTRLLHHVASRVRQPDQFLARIAHLYAHPEETSREEIEFKDGMVLDRYTAPVLSKEGKCYGRIWTFRDITERKQAEEALRESEERYRSIIQNMQDIYYRTDEKGRLVMFSPSVLAMLGYDSTDELLGRPADMFYADPARRQEFLMRLRAEGALKDYEVALRRRDGSILLVATTSAFYRDPEGNVLGVEGIFRDITERKQAEKALREREAYLTAIIENQPGLVWLKDSESRFLAVNTKFATSCGNKSPADLVGNTDLDIWPQELAAKYRLDDRKVMQSGQPTIVEELILDQGEPRWFETFKMPVRDGLGSIIGTTGYAFDITERKQAEEALRESEERYRTLFEQSLDAIAIQEGVPPAFTWVNPAFCELFGYTAEEVYALTAREMWGLVHPEDRDLVRDSLTKRLTGQEAAARYGFRIIRKDGAARWVDVTGRRMQGGARPMNLSIYRDITERKMIEEALTQARDAADAANRAKSEFLANMSHEIRTPLNGIMGMIQLLNNSALDGEQQRYAQAALLSSQRLTRLLGDILDISRIEARKFTLENAPFVLADVLESVRALFWLPAEQKGLELSLSLDATLPRLLLGDEHRLRQVLFNLVGNAVKFTESGGIRLEASRLGTQAEEPCRVLFVVTDTGEGIPEELLSQSFQMFTQAEGALNRRHQGAGLGLAIVRHLVVLMGGKSIDVSSEEGRGTTFSFVLPFGLPAQDLADDGNGADEEGVQTSLDGMRVLLVEDEEINQLALRTGLLRLGLTVVCVGDGEAALAALREGDYDCILMDIQMPGMNGLEATQAIRTWPEFRHRADIPIIALTAFAMSGDRERFLAAGMDGYLPKPFSFVELSRLLGRVRRQRAAQAQPA